MKQLLNCFLAFLVAATAMAQTIPQPLVPGMITAYNADLEMYRLKYPLQYGIAYMNKMVEVNDRFAKKLNALPFATLSYSDQVDYLLFQRRLKNDRKYQDELKENFYSTRPALGFDSVIVNFEQLRRKGAKQDGSILRSQFLTSIEKIGQLKQQFPQYNLGQLRYIQSAIGNLRETIKNTLDFYNGYDPTFTSEVIQSIKNTDSSLKNYASIVEAASKKLQPADSSGISGSPIGYEEMVKGLTYEMIPYTPEQVIAIANREFAWCEAEMLKASAAMGFGKDWKAALEKVKTAYVPIGEQPELVKFLADEAVEFIEKRNLVTIPQEAKDGWSMRMLTPEEQKFAPFFLGGRQILIAYPHSSMTEIEKQMSLRGNNKHFSRAVVHHELIPGHNLQYFMGRRYKTYRQGLGTSFWTEGWALYWEMLLYDKNFAPAPEDKVGMLFWRMHRCARIIFSINYHTGKWTPAECINFLVDKVGFERANAEAEVRRSFAGNYGPLYQIGYMLGGLQFRSLYQEIVGSGRMPVKEFHDRILQEGSMPVELVRAILLKQKLSKDFTTKWKFAGNINP